MLPTNAQEYYDLLVQSSIDGTFPSVKLQDGTTYPKCKYRKDGTANCKQRCAAGLLISDGKYDPEMDIEFMTFGNKLECYNGISNLIKYKIIELPEGITELDVFTIQSIHDYCAREYALCDKKWNPSVLIDKFNLLVCFKDVKKIVYNKDKDKLQPI